MKFSLLAASALAATVPVSAEFFMKEQFDDEVRILQNTIFEMFTAILFGWYFFRTRFYILVHDIRVVCHKCLYMPSILKIYRLTNIYHFYVGHRDGKNVGLNPLLGNQNRKWVLGLPLLVNSTATP